MPKSRSGEKIKMLSYDELLGGANLTEGRTELEISKIYAFENHPFRVVDAVSCIGSIEKQNNYIRL